MNLSLQTYAVANADRILTPALLIYPALVDRNLEATLRLVKNDPNRWRPHIKTAKLGFVVRAMIERGIRNFKCATTLELLTACQSGADDVLLAFSVVGANAGRTIEIQREFPQTRISVSVESPSQAERWLGTPIGIFIDLNPGMDRTGIAVDDTETLLKIARLAQGQFRGLHFYDGHVTKYKADGAEREIHAGYDRLLQQVKKLQADGIDIEEVITSGTPAAPAAMSYPGFNEGPFIHRISPGTVVYNDLNSLGQLPNLGYVPAALVLSTVISHPTANVVTCDGGHKSVSADSGVPTCAVLGQPDLTPGKPSEEHLPIEVAGSASAPAIGDQLYLLPKHVCPTVNNFDEAYLVVDGQIMSVEPVSARGHETRREDPSLIPA